MATNLGTAFHLRFHETFPKRWAKLVTLRFTPPFRGETRNVKRRNVPSAKPSAKKQPRRNER
jgi:hypothetical protein